MTGTFFRSSFEKSGIDVATPDAREIDYVGEKIAGELEYGRVIPETCQGLERIARSSIED